MIAIEKRKGGDTNKEVKTLWTALLTISLNRTAPKRGERWIFMKTMMKRIAMFTLSACMLAGGAVSSFAADASSHYTAAILSHQTDACEGTEKAELTVRFSSPYGDVQDYVI